MSLQNPIDATLSTLSILTKFKMATKMAAEFFKIVRALKKQIKHEVYLT